MVILGWRGVLRFLCVLYLWLFVQPLQRVLYCPIYFSAVSIKVGLIHLKDTDGLHKLIYFFPVKPCAVKKMDLGDELLVMLDKMCNKTYKTLSFVTVNKFILGVFENVLFHFLQLCYVFSVLCILGAFRGAANMEFTINAYKCVSS